MLTNEGNQEYPKTALPHLGNVCFCILIIAASPGKAKTPLGTTWFGSNNVPGNDRMCLSHGHKTPLTNKPCGLRETHSTQNWQERQRSLVGHSFRNRISPLILREDIDKVLFHNYAATSHQREGTRHPLGDQLPALTVLTT